MALFDELKSKSVRKVEKPLHLIIFIVNIFFSGVGTMITGCISKEGFSVYTILVGLVQLLTAWLIVGWIWSIFWGYLIFKKSD
ncbi:UNKNOWN [Stylonychia lemnae]|uniref:Transmembrane protein n=1 Tax=Stylonychia lemnae TaxID=5949 RepID=A0A078AL46_STYLE|nr:UNKNOWN [Stylonychia lemnae]|eukprot:CDW82909.1 UNKNOWN [Stylonychia lemnae]